MVHCATAKSADATAKRGSACLIVCCAGFAGKMRFVVNIRLLLLQTVVWAGFMGVFMRDS